MYAKTSAKKSPLGLVPPGVMNSFIHSFMQKSIKNLVSTSLAGQSEESSIRTVPVSTLSKVRVLIASNHSFDFDQQQVYRSPTTSISEFKPPLSNKLNR